MTTNLIEQLRQADQLPSAPGVALEIIRLQAQEDVDTRELSLVLSRDPALAAKLVRAANSAAFGLPRQVTSLHQAIVILGIRTVNILALAFSLLPIAKGKNGIGFDYQEYWTHSVASNLAAVLLAKQVDPSLRDEAFLSGLLCEIGRLVLVEWAPEEYGPVLERLEGSTLTLHELETEVLGINHMQVAHDLLGGWGFPTVVCDAIGAHHDPSLLDQRNGKAVQLAQILHVATTCGELFTVGEVEKGVDQLGILGAGYFSMDLEACDSLLAKVEQELPKAASLYELETKDARALSAIRARASELLVRETLALNAQVEEATRETRKLEKEMEALEEQATTDPLTGLRNRRFFDEFIRSEFSRVNEENQTLGVLLLDLDHFKSVNDRYGHVVGDQLLRRVGEVLRSTLRDGECAARYGGEELALICAGVTPEQLEERAEEAREAIARISIDTPLGTVTPTTSVGGSILDPLTDLGSAESLVRAADLELYRAKEAGRNCVSVVSASLQSGKA